MIKGIPNPCICHGNAVFTVFQHRMHPGEARVSKCRSVSKHDGKNMMENFSLPYLLHVARSVYLYYALGQKSSNGCLTDQ